MCPALFVATSGGPICVADCHLGDEFVVRCFDLWRRQMQRSANKNGARLKRALPVRIKYLDQFSRFKSRWRCPEGGDQGLAQAVAGGGGDLASIFTSGVGALARATQAARWIQGTFGRWVVSSAMLQEVGGSGARERLRTSVNYSSWHHSGRPLAIERPPQRAPVPPT